MQSGDLIGFAFAISFIGLALTAVAVLIYAAINDFKGNPDAVEWTELPSVWYCPMGDQIFLKTADLVDFGDAIYEFEDDEEEFLKTFNCPGRPDIVKLGDF